MNIDKLKKWNAVSIVLIIVFLIIHLIVMSAVIYSAFHHTSLTDAPRMLIKMICLTPIAVVFAAILARSCCVSEIKKRECVK